jgi:hypothetical protein
MMGFLLLAAASKTALRPTQPPVQWVLGAITWGEVAGA